MASLTSFHAPMSQDPSLFEAFKSDPSAAMTEAGLSYDDQEILLSRDRERLAAAIDPDDEAAADLDIGAFWAQ